VVNRLPNPETDARVMSRMAPASPLRVYLGAELKPRYHLAAPSVLAAIDEPATMKDQDWAIFPMPRGERAGTLSAVHRLLITYPLLFLLFSSVLAFSWGGRSCIKVPDMDTA
jgi:hypothetical protein